MEHVVNVLPEALQKNNIILERDAVNPKLDSARESWNLISARLSGKMDKGMFLAWIKPLTVSKVSVSRDNSSESTAEIFLEAPNKFSAEHLERNYTALIGGTAADCLEVTSAKVVFGVASTIQSSSSSVNNTTRSESSTNTANSSSEPRIVSRARVNSDKPVRSRSVRDESNLNPNYNFSNIVVGSCNQFAHAVSLRVSENLGTVYNPLFIYGGVGLGKTHLANAIGNAARRRGKKVLLVSSEQFVSELIAALRTNNMHAFKSKFRSLDLLIVDDVQFIIGKERTQEEFFHTFNELHQRHKQIIMTSDKVPQELVGLEERLRTRFASGISADLQAPDFETRVAILSKKAEAAGVFLPEEVSRIIASRIDTNVRELEGALNRLLALSSLNSSAISVELAEEVLQRVAPEKRIEITTEMIQNVVAKKFNVSVSDLLGKRRTQNIAMARQVAMYLCRKLARCSYPEIGALFGGRDHSTAIHAKRVVEERINGCDKFRVDIESLEQNFLSR